MCACIACMCGVCCHLPTTGKGMGVHEGAATRHRHTPRLMLRLIPFGGKPPRRRLKCRICITYICIYVYIYICMYVCIYIYIYIYLYIHIWPYVYIYIYIHTYTHLCMHVCVYIYIYIHTYKDNIYIYIYIYEIMNEHIHAYMYTTHIILVINSTYEQQSLCTYCTVWYHAAQHGRIQCDT